MQNFGMPMIAVWILLGALLASLAPAQRPADTFSGSTVSLLVEVPVEVTFEGEPLRGLTAENFKLTDDGDRQQILSVEEIDLAHYQADSEEGDSLYDLPVSARRHFLLLFDRSYVGPVAFEKARAAASQLIREDLHPADLVGVATYSRSRGAEWLLGFTPDRQQVARALTELGVAESRLVSGDPLRLSIEAVDSGGGGDGGGNRRGSAREAAAELARELEAMRDKSRQAEKIAEVGFMSRSLGSLADVMRRLDGRKHVVFFSEGFDDQLLTGTTDQERRDDLVRSAQDNQLWLVDSEDYFGSSTAVNVVDSMNQQFRRADATVHTVDVGGLRAAGSALSQGRGTGRSGRGGLFMIARGTGGELYENFNDLGGAMRTMLEKTSVTYLLTFAPKDLEHDGSYRKLKVRLENTPRKARITHRPGYFAPDGQAPGGLEAQLDVAQRLFDDRPGEIGTELLAMPMRLEDPRAAAVYVPVLIEVEGESFLAKRAGSESAASKKSRSGKSRSRKSQPEGSPGHGDDGVRAELYLYAFGARGQVADVFSQTVELDMARVGDTLHNRGFKFYAPLMLGAGNYTLRALVRNSHTGYTGLQVQALQVEPRSTVSSVLMPPLFPESVDSWPLVRGRHRVLGREQEPAYPFVHGGTTYIPAARPELTAGQTVPVFLAGYALGAPASVISELRDGTGETIATPRWRLDPSGLEGPGGLKRHLAAFEMPSVPAGDYTLHLEILSQDARRSTAGQLALRLVDGEPSSQLLTLGNSIEFGPRRESREAATTAESTVQNTHLEMPEDEMPMDELVEVYQRAVEGLNGAQRGSLLVELAAAEAVAVEKRPERAVKRLARAQRTAQRSMAGGDTEALVPLIVLHHDLFLEHRAARRPWLQNHSLEMSRQLAQLYAERGGSQGSRIVASRALASLGGYLQLSGRSACRELFEQALALDPSNEAARLGMAADYEKRGGPYDKVVAQLKKLIELKPESREGRLRLGVNLLRSAALPGAMDVAAKKAAAEQHWRSLVVAEESDWIHSLAAQELSRQLARTGRRGDAVEILRAALARHPSDQKLALQLAFLLDRGRESSASRDLLERVRQDLKEGRGREARGRYNHYPSEALETARRELRQGSELRSTRLLGAGSQR